MENERGGSVISAYSKREEETSSLSATQPFKQFGTDTQVPPPVPVYGHQHFRLRFILLETEHTHASGISHNLTFWHSNQNFAWATR